MIIRSSHKKDFIVIWGSAFILAALLYVFSGFLNFGLETAFPGFAVIAVGSIAVSIMSVLKHRHSYLQLTENEVIQHKGILNLSSISVSYSKIDNIRTRRELMNRIVGLVDLEIDTPGDKGVEIMMKNLPYNEFEAFYSELKEKMETAKNKENKGQDGQAK